MIKAMPMEDWLRGCIYHDGRHGYVTLSTDKVHQIANYIQRTRRSATDGLIDLEVVEADRKTEPQKKEVEWDYNKRERLWYPYSNGELLFNDKPTTQTETQNSNLTFEKRTMRDCYNCKKYETEGECIECHYEPKDEPQTTMDCSKCECFTDGGERCDLCALGVMDEP